MTRFSARQHTKVAQATESELPLLATGSNLLALAADPSLRVPLGFDAVARQRQQAATALAIPENTLSDQQLYCTM
jgi:hypothetical protein